MKLVARSDNYPESIIQFTDCPIKQIKTETIKF